MARTITTPRPWFTAKLASESGIAAAVDDAIDSSDVVAAKLDIEDFETQLAEGASGDVPEPTAYEAPTVSTNFTEEQAQAVADAVEGLTDVVIALIAALEARGVITVDDD